MNAKVSIAMITYNHEKFIGQAIESVLNQDYPNFEIVIGEDCSTDNTWQIIKKYQKKFPNKIKLISRSKNVGMHINFDEVFKECDGKYVATIEGDDYWTNIRKLSTQVSFLEKNMDFSMCFHSVNEYHEVDKTIKVRKNKINNRDEFSFIDFFKQNMHVNTASVMYRKIDGFEIPKWTHELAFGDKPVHIYHALEGKVKFINENMAVYRVHDGGVATIASKNLDGQLKFIQSEITMLMKFNKLTNFKYATDIEVGLGKILIFKWMTLLQDSQISIMKEIPFLSSLPEYLNSLKDRNGKNGLLFWGAGATGTQINMLCNDNKIYIDGWIDSDICKQGCFINEVEIYSIDFIPKLELGDKLIVITSEYSDEISEVLLKKGYIIEKDFVSLDRIFGDSYLQKVSLGGI